MWPSWHGSPGFRADCRAALRVVWGVLSLGILALLLASVFCVPADLAWFPECSARLAGTGCPLCGMTAAFCAIARGDLPGAWTLNRGSLPLYGLFLANTIIFWQHRWRLATRAAAARDK